LIWAPIVDRLAAERDVIAVDLPGFGRSPALPAERPASPANLAAALGTLCAELGIERPHLAGNSLGGWVALELAKTGRAASVCALSPAGLWRKPLGPRERDLRRVASGLRRLLPTALASSRLRVALLRTTMAHPERLSRAEASALIGDWLSSSGYEDANREMRSRTFERPDLVRVPVTIAWGSEDRLLRAPRPERMPPGSRYVVLDGCGHTPTWDDPERIASLILEAGGGASAAGGAQAGSGRFSPGQEPVSL
jgi:pimeloyl-ACP methyl ester carboxylesterase